MNKWEQWKLELKVGKNACYRCRKGGRDRGGDNFTYYGEDDGGHCFSCGMTIPSGSLISVNENAEEFDFVAKEFNDEIHDKLKEITSTDSKGFRGIRKDITGYFGVRHEYDEETGEVIKQFYPCTVDGHLSGYKLRKVPKSFDHYGETGKEADPFAWFRFHNSTQKTCVITAGEIDALSCYQILSDYTKKKNQEQYGFYPVVSSTLGESSVVQLQEKYSWFDRFEKIIICYDNDDAGRAATEKLAKVLPRGKIYIMELVLKDCNCYLWDTVNNRPQPQAKQDEFINIFFKARKHTPAGIVGSDVIMGAMLEKSEVLKVTLPDFLSKLSKMLAGGFRLKQIVNIVAATSIGKTTLINAIVKHILFNSPYMVGVISLEADVPEYGQSLLSEHIGRKLSLIEDSEELRAILLSEYVQEKSKELFLKEDGSPRFYLLDDRGDYTGLENKIKELVISCGCAVILLDPLSDALAGKSNEEQEMFMAFQKEMIKGYDVLFLNVIHTRKAQSGQKDGGRGADMDESAMFGSSSISKSAHINILLQRDKYAEDELDRNTTRVTLPKNRAVGITGDAGEIYYEIATHKLWDKDVWLEKIGKQF